MFDEDKTSPVSGTIIRELAEDETLVVRKVRDSYSNKSSEIMFQIVNKASQIISTIYGKVAQELLIRRSYHAITVGCAAIFLIASTIKRV